MESKRRTKPGEKSPRKTSSTKARPALSEPLDHARGESKGVRLQKLISEAGLASRRAAEQLIVDGRVMVNGVTVRELGTRADPVADDVRVDGRRLPRPERRHILLFKPRGYVSTRVDPQKRPTVIDLLERAKIRGYFYPVGRLDYDSDGLIILTNDGAFAERLMHPRYELERAYEARVRGVPDEKSLDRLRKGISLEGERTQPARITLQHVSEGKAVPQAVLEVVLKEGRNRQVRRMFEAIGHPVYRLTRVRIGSIRIGHMKPGDMRELTPREIASLTSHPSSASRT